MDKIVIARSRNMNNFRKTGEKRILHGHAVAALAYRAFLLDINNCVFAARVLITKNHEDALRLAQQIRTPCDMIEVWCGTIKLGLVAPRNKIGLAIPDVPVESPPPSRRIA
jgi:hypothetical protein